MKRFLNNIKFKLELLIFNICFKYTRHFESKHYFSLRKHKIVITHAEPLLIQGIKHVSQVEVDNHPDGLKFFVDQTKNDMFKHISANIEVNVSVSESSIEVYTIHTHIRVLKTVK